MPVEVTPIKTISWPKVILTVVIITVVTGLISGGLFWYYYIRQPETQTSATITKQATSSAKPVTPSAQKDETASWLSFENKIYKFSFKYPKNWYVDMGAAGHTVLTNYKEGEGRGFDPKLDKGKLKLDFDKIAKGSTVTLETYVDDYVSKIMPPMTLKSKTTTIVDSKKAIIAEYESGSLFGSVFIERDSTSVYVISSNNDYPGTKDEFLKVLSTFKFLPSQ